jgi:hypothetical protein
VVQRIQNYYAKLHDVIAWSKYGLSGNGQMDTNGIMMIHGIMVQFLRMPKFSSHLFDGLYTKVIEK